MCFKNQMVNIFFSLQKKKGGLLGFNQKLVLTNSGPF